MTGEQLLMALVQDDAFSTPGEKNIKGIYSDRRDDTLASRFYYYTKLHHKNYDYALEQLSLEFYLTESVVYQHLKMRADFIKDLSAKNTTVGDLKKMYPYISWSNPSVMHVGA